MRRPLPLLIEGLILFLASVGLIIWIIILRNISITEDEFQGVIFHEAHAADELGFMLTKDNLDDEYWTPHKKEILDIEMQLKIRTQEQLPALSSQLSLYKRQYFGFTRGGKDIVFFVGFCQPVDVDWKNEFVSMPMAADCYFEAQYDIAEDRLLYVWERTAR